MVEFARALRAAGVTLLQYRDKTGDERALLENAERIGELFEGSGAKLIMNDRADVMLLARWDGVHVGQEDLSPEDARIVIGDGRLVGVSTHTEEQVKAAQASVADYVAIGPVFATGTKLNAAPVVGARGGAAGTGADDQAAGGHRRDYAGECAERDRGGGGFGGGDRGIVRE